MHILTERDAYLARLVHRYGPPPLWARPAGFSTLVHIVLEQQVSIASAAALHARLERELHGLTAESASLRGPEGLRRLGLTRQKAHYVSSLADRVAAGELELSRLDQLSDEEAAAQLMRVPGIGPWTASIYLLMVLLRPDVWPTGDLALHRMLARREPAMDRLTREQADMISGGWRPLRAVAARILWHTYLSERVAGSAARHSRSMREHVQAPGDAHPV